MACFSPTFARLQMSQLRWRRISATLENIGKSGGSPKRGSHLGRFVEAKRKIGTIFEDLEDYVASVATTLGELREKRESLVPSSVVEETESLRGSVATIREMLGRNHMKVVFFGRTSNGKSTVVNAMLHSKVLPQGMGHTTRCFIQVEGSEDGRKCVVREGEGGVEEETDISSIESLASALSHGSQLGDDSLVKVFWPAADSRLLQNDLVLVDSPGVDLSPQFDAWIDGHCLDADVFVLVCNAESTLTQAEKNFFHRVAAKLSRPNLFILNNRWDASANEPESIHRVREQHEQRFAAFLVDELGTCKKEEMKDRVFFVSAKEVLHQRLKERGLATPTTFLADGFQARSLEFATFEENFETVISKSAIQTKFETHLSRGKDVATRLHQLLHQLAQQTDKERAAAWAEQEREVAELREGQRKLLHFVSQSKEQIMRLSGEVQLRVSEDFRDCIRRLEGYVDSYRKSFSDSPEFLPAYKQDLIAFVDDAVSSDLNIRFTGGLRDSILRTQRQMIENVRLILPEEAGTRAVSLLSYREPFRFSVTVDCAGLALDFVEDLEFRFSLGLPQLVRRFVQLRRAAMGTDEVPPPQPLLPRGISSSGDASSALAARRVEQDEDVLMKGLILTSASYVANGGVGLLLIGGLVYRTVGWRVIAILGGAYGGIYLWERARWNGHAKEQALKDQLRRHLASRLRQLSQIITCNCDAQVTREVQEVMARLQSLANETAQQQKADIDRRRQDVEALDHVAKQLNQTKGRSTFITSELETFAVQFLNGSAFK